jgi:hypothetical protein
LLPQSTNRSAPAPAINTIRTVGLDPVVADAADQHVAGADADQRVVAIAAIEAPRPADVEAVIGQQVVVAATAIERAAAGIVVEPVIAIGAEQQAVAGRHLIGRSVFADQVVVAVAAGDQIAAAAAQRVDGDAAEKSVVAGAAAAYDTDRCSHDPAPTFASPCKDGAAPVWRAMESSYSTCT